MEHTEETQVTQEQVQTLILTSQALALEIASDEECVQEYHEIIQALDGICVGKRTHSIALVLASMTKTFAERTEGPEMFTIFLVQSLMKLLHKAEQHSTKLN